MRVVTGSAAVAFENQISPIPSDIEARMRGVSWHPSLPGGFVPPGFDQLRLLRVRHRDFNGDVQTGELIVERSVAEVVLEVFELIYERRFPLAKVRLIDHYAGDDDRSMQDNNTSAFNCRLVAGTTRPSKHALGVAVDINPLQNPFIVGSRVYPPEATAYVDRSVRRSGMLFEDEPIVQAFERHGWTWGGRWSHPIDYHHFEFAG